MWGLPVASETTGRCAKGRTVPDKYGSNGAQVETFAEAVTALTPQDWEEVTTRARAVGHMLPIAKGVIAGLTHNQHAALVALGKRVVAQLDLGELSNYEKGRAGNVTVLALEALAARGVAQADADAVDLVLSFYQGMPVGL